MQEKNATNLGNLIDISAQMKEDPKKVGPGKKIKVKVYPLSPEGARDPMGKLNYYQETSKEREKYTKG